MRCASDIDDVGSDVSSNYPLIKPAYHRAIQFHAWGHGVVCDLAAEITAESPSESQPNHSPNHSLNHG